jgi:hypothetical protein
VTTASDREIIQARAARHDDEFEHLLTSAIAVMQLDPVAGIVRALFCTAEALSAEAADLEARKKKGYVTECRNWRDAAMKVRGLATQVENYGARNPNREWWTLESDRAALDAIVAGLPNGSLQVDGILVPPVGPTEPAASGHYAPGLPEGYGVPLAPMELQTPGVADFLAGRTDIDPLGPPLPVIAVNGVPTANPLPPDTLAPGDTVTLLGNPFRAPVPIEPVHLAAEPPPLPVVPQPAVPTEAVNPFRAPKAPGRMVARPSFLDVATLAADLPFNPDSSYSQIKTVRQCTMQHVLGRLSRRGLIGPERPGWGAVGGTALHVAIEAYENWFETHTDPAPTTTEIDAMWLSAFATTVEEVRAAAGPYQDLDQWHASNRRKEGYDWWRVEGRTMLQRYADTHAQGWADRLSLVAQEWEYRLPITDTITSHGFVDQVWSDAEDPIYEGNLIIDDLKSGARLPKDVVQLGEYAWALVKVRGIDPTRISEVAYWNARTGERTAYADILERVTWDDLVYYHVSTSNAKVTSTPTANITDLCSGCSVKDLCPALRM